MPSPRPFIPITALVLLAVLLAGCGSLFPPRPEVRWDPSPDALIVRATFCCGYVPPAVAENYIPDAQVWGDGRIVWVQSSGITGERRVLQGRLTTAEMTALLQRVVDQGFFGWQDNYADTSIADMASQCLLVELDDQHKMVCEYYRGAPRAFHDLYAEIADGASASGTGLVPSQGYLTAHPMDYSGGYVPDPSLHWPAEALGLSLAQAAGGIWVEGKVLELAWRTVNQDISGGVVQEGEAYYRLAVQIPGLSQGAPLGP